MRTSVITFEDRARQRFLRLAWHVRLHARDDSEARGIDQLCTAVREGTVTVADGHAVLGNLQCEQQDEQQRQHAA